MDRLRSTIFTALVITLMSGPATFAQTTAAKVEVVAGNGQLVCPNCQFKNPVYFYPMVVKVTDASGKPIAGKTVDWALTGFPPPSVFPVYDTQTVTDKNGIAFSQLFQANGQTGTSLAPFMQSVITASVDNQAVNFVETQALTDINSSQIVFARLVSPDPASVPFSGPAGSVSKDPIKIHVDGRGVPVPGVSVRIQNPDPATLPSAKCVTASGAPQPGTDPGTVLTDENGDGACYLLFGPVAGKSPVNVLVGGLNPDDYDYSNTQQPLTSAVAFFEYDGIQLNVSAVTPGRISIVSGNNQTLNPGQSSAPLVAVVSDSTGAINIANTSVQWTVSPVGAATLSSSQTTTNSLGQAQTTVVLAPNAVGQITVRAALTGANSGINTTFTITTNVQISSMTKVSGDAQTAPAGQNFGAPLVVQLTGTNGQPVVNQPVNFAVASGSATINSTSSATDGNGRAQATVKAGSAGAVTVTASVGNISQTFNLTVIPPGPSLSPSSFYSFGSAARISALAPCSIVTVIATGLAPNVQGLVLNSSAFGPWSGSIANDTVQVNGVGAPIFSVGTVNGLEQLSFQVPCDAAVASSVPVTINVGGGAATVNMPVQSANPGILETVMTDNVRRAVVVRPDGSFVSLQNPARRGEQVRVFVTGLGPSIPQVGSGSLPVPGTDALIAGQVIVGVNNAGARVVTSRVSPNLIGVSEVAFVVPSDAPTGNDVVLSVAVNVPSDAQTRFSNGSKLPIQ